MISTFCKTATPHHSCDAIKHNAPTFSLCYRSLFIGAALCVSAVAQAAPSEPQTVVSAPWQMNGIAVSHDGRIFVGMPRWIQQDSFSIGEYKGGNVVPYPGNSWNDWSKKESPEKHFVNINALRIEMDKPNDLWAVDCTQGKGGAKLIKLDLTNNSVARVYHFDSKIVPVPGGCLNDVRVAGTHAFLTESGTGAIITVDLQSGKARRLLATSQKTKFVAGKNAVIDGVAERTPQGGIPIVNADGIEISPDKQWLYFCMPLGGDLWRVKIADLLNPSLTEKQLDQRVESQGVLIPVGGILMLPDGNMLLSDVEHHAIKLRHPDGTLSDVTTSSALLDWPDAMAIGPDGTIYTAAAQANKVPVNNNGKDATKPPFRILSFKL